MENNIIGGIVVFILALVIVSVALVLRGLKINTSEKPYYNYEIEASQLVDYFYRQNIPVRYSVIKETLENIDYFLPHYFPDGPFNRKDFISIAIIESNFSQYLVGTSGEKGIFQIMQQSSNYMGVKKDQFDIKVNTELSMFVLKGKFDQHQDYRKAIIAYNGVIVDKNNKWRDVYWKKFSKARMEVDITLGGK